MTEVLDQSGFWFIGDIAFQESWIRAAQKIQLHRNSSWTRGLGIQGSLKKKICRADGVLAWKILVWSGLDSILNRLKYQFFCQTPGPGILIVLSFLCCVLDPSPLGPVLVW